MPFFGGVGSKPKKNSLLSPEATLNALAGLPNPNRRPTEAEMRAGVKGLLGNPQPQRRTGPVSGLMSQRKSLFAPDMPASKPAEAKAKRPNVTERLGNYVADALMATGLKKHEAVNLGHRVTSFLADLTPGGNADGILYPKNDFDRQLSMLPLPGPVRGAVKQGLQRGIRAYHGSPHDFDKFDISKIGTGEGAQAYGRGLYFAENEAVAREYRDGLSRGVLQGPDRLLDPTDIDDIDTRAAARLLTEHRTPEAAKAFAHSHYAGRQPVQISRNIDKLIDQGFRPAGGRLYEVDINTTPNALLDWDRPVGQQPQLNTLMDLARENRMSRGLGLEDPAGAFYQGLADSVGPYPGSLAGRAKASNALAEAGIPGIQYYDQLSREAGQGTRNYVVFDDRLIDIRNKR